MATERLYEVTAPEAMLTFRSDRHTSRPWGLAGGLPGQNSSVAILRGGERLDVPPKFTRALQRGDVLHSVMQSGGGWGDPLDRDPEAVLTDLLDEKIDSARAHGIYGVVLVPDQSSVDVDATTTLRAERKGARTSVHASGGSR